MRDLVKRRWLDWVVCGGFALLILFVAGTRFRADPFAYMLCFGVAMYLIYEGFIRPRR